jgi:hypothetical protein
MWRVVVLLFSPSDMPARLAIIGLGYMQVKNVRANNSCRLSTEESCERLVVATLRASAEAPEELITRQHLQLPECAMLKKTAAGCTRAIAQHWVSPALTTSINVRFGSVPTGYAVLERP